MSDANDKPSPGPRGMSWKAAAARLRGMASEPRSIMDMAILVAVADYIDGIAEPVKRERDEAVALLRRLDIGVEGITPDGHAALEGARAFLDGIDGKR